MPQTSITQVRLKITYPKFHSNFPGANELRKSQLMMCHHSTVLLFLWTLHFYMEMLFGSSQKKSFQTLSRLLSHTMSLALPSTSEWLWKFSQNEFHCDDIMPWTDFLHYWPFVLGIHQLLWIPTTKGLWWKALMFSLLLARISFWTNSWVADEMSSIGTHVTSPLLQY